VDEQRFVVQNAEHDLTDALHELAKPDRAVGVVSLRKRRGQEPELHAVQMYDSNDIRAAVDGSVVIRHRHAREPRPCRRVVVHAARTAGGIVELTQVRRGRDLVGQAGEPDARKERHALPRVVVLHLCPQILERGARCRLDVHGHVQRDRERRRVRIVDVEVLAPHEESTRRQQRNRKSLEQ